MKLKELRQLAKERGIVSNPSKYSKKRLLEMMADAKDEDAPLNETPARVVPNAKQRLWIQALQEWNRAKKTEVYTIPKKGTKAYDEVKLILHRLKSSAQ